MKFVGKEQPLAPAIYRPSQGTDAESTRAFVSRDQAGIRMSRRLFLQNSKSSANSGAHENVFTVDKRYAPRGECELTGGEGELRVRTTTAIAERLAQYAIV